MYAEVVLDVAELLDFLLAELALEDVLEAPRLVVDAKALDVVLGELLRGVVCGHLVFVWVNEILIIFFHDVTLAFLGFFNVAGCMLYRSALQLSCLVIVVNNCNSRFFVFSFCLDTGRLWRNLRWTLGNQV